MKFKYKGKEGIRALELMKKDRKVKPRKIWKERRGILSRLCDEMLYSGNRRVRRQEAKDVIKDPLAFDHLFKK